MFNWTNRNNLIKSLCERILCLERQVQELQIAEYHNRNVRKLLKYEDNTNWIDPEDGAKIDLSGSSIRELKTTPSKTEVVDQEPKKVS